MVQTVQRSSGAAPNPAQGHSSQPARQEVAGLVQCRPFLQNADWTHSDPLWPPSSPRHHHRRDTSASRLSPMTYCVSPAAVTVHFRRFKVITGGEDASASIIQTARRSVTHRKLEHRDSKSSTPDCCCLFHFFSSLLWQTAQPAHWHWARGRGEGLQLEKPNYFSLIWL